jgi:hypothetical protein
MDMIRHDGEVREFESEAFMSLFKDEEEQL